MKYRDKVKPQETYNKWTVLGRDFRIGKYWWAVCQCKCGFVNVVMSDNLVSGTNKGCKECKRCARLQMPNIKIGDVFGVMTLMSAPYYDKNRECNKWRVDVECKCGWVGDVSAQLILKRKGYHRGCKYYSMGKCKKYGSKKRQIQGRFLEQASQEIHRHGLHVWQTMRAWIL